MSILTPNPAASSTTSPRTPAPTVQPPLTDCPRTEAVFPFTRVTESDYPTDYYRLHTPQIEVCEGLERENVTLKAKVKELEETVRGIGQDVADLRHAAEHDSRVIEELRDQINKLRTELEEAKEAELAWAASSDHYAEKAWRLERKLNGLPEEDENAH